MASKQSYGPTKGTGVVYLPSWNVYKEQPIDAETIQKFSENVYGAGLYRKQKNLVFQDRVRIEVLDPENNVHEETQTALERMFFSNPDVNIAARMEQAFHDIFFYGLGVFNPIWKKKNGTIELVQMRHLPAYSFGELPPGRDQYSKVMAGITVGKDGKIEFWQTTGVSAVTKQLEKEHLFWVKEPSSTDIAGDPMIRPLIPVLEMLTFAWNSEMQTVNRQGAPIFFIRITNPQDASDENGNVSDEDYANMILQTWGKDTAYPLRDNMEIITPDLKDGGVTLDAINALQAVIIDYMSPSSFISKDGTLIGGSAAPEAELMEAYISGIHRFLEAGFNRLIEYYLRANRYPEGFTGRFILTYKSAEDKQSGVARAETGFKTKVVHPNEIREDLGKEGLDEAELLKIAQIWREFLDVLGPAAAPAPVPNLLAADPATLQNALTPEKMALIKKYRDRLQRVDDRLKNQTIALAEKIVPEGA